MKKRILKILLAVARFAGLFGLSRKITAAQLRILCYHGSALIDENHFRPGLFITTQTFLNRMAHLSAAGYPVIPLDDALTQLRNGNLPAGATVITIDDGWYGTYKNQVPALRQYEFPATLYCASYYLENQTQVFNVAISYVLWRQGINEVPAKFLVDLIGAELVGTDMVDAEVACKQLEAFADSLDGAAQRQELLARLCVLIDFDIETIERERLISFMNREEVGEAAQHGLDIQLHTHRHCFPDTSFEAAKQEIDDNKQYLSRISPNELHHFCYPSGIYSPRSIEHLKKLGIRSATTAKPGFNSSDADPFELTRFLDSENISDIEFEAEMSGFLELIRRTGFNI